MLCSVVGEPAANRTGHPEYGSWQTGAQACSLALSRYHRKMRYPCRVLFKYRGDTPDGLVWSSWLLSVKNNQLLRRTVSNFSLQIWPVSACIDLMRLMTVFLKAPGLFNVAESHVALLEWAIPGKTYGSTGDMVLFALPGHVHRDLRLCFQPGFPFLGSMFPS